MFSNRPTAPKLPCHCNIADKATEIAFMGLSVKPARLSVHFDISRQLQRKPSTYLRDM
jgi:hypothetical protein